MNLSSTERTRPGGSSRGSLTALADAQVLHKKQVDLSGARKFRGSAEAAKRRVKAPGQRAVAALYVAPRRSLGKLGLSARCITLNPYSSIGAQEAPWWTPHLVSPLDLAKNRKLCCCACNGLLD